MRFSVLFSTLALALTGCHQVCGSTAPLWVQADCVILPADVPDDLPELEGCDAVVRVLIDGTTEAAASSLDVVGITAEIENLTDETLDIVLADPCPSGLVQFEGLAEGTDIYGDCQKGACSTFGESMVITIEAGEALVIDETLSLEGDVCNGALEAGVYWVTGSLPLFDDAQPEVCALGAELTVSP